MHLMYTSAYVDFINQAIYYSTGVQIVSCTLSDDSVFSEITVLFNPVLCVSQWNLFDKKLPNQIVSFKSG